MIDGDVARLARRLQSFVGTQHIPAMPIGIANQFIKMIDHIWLSYVPHDAPWPASVEILFYVHIFKNKSYKQSKS